MKCILFFITTLFHTMCSADSIGRSCIATETDNVTILQPTQPYGMIVAGSSTNLDYQRTNNTRTVSVPNPVAFSTQHKHFHHHNATPHYDLNHMSTEQLMWYFSSHGYTEDQILGSKELFASAAFVALAKQLPKYAEYVKKYYEEYRKFNWYTKFVGRVFSFYTRGFQDTFTRLYRECEQKRSACEEDTRKQNMLAAYCAKLDSLAHDDLTFDAVPHPHQQAREKACAQIKTNALDRFTRTYTVTQDTVTFAHEYAITEHDLTSLQGNTYEQQLHTEFLEQLSEAHTIYTSYALPKNILIDAIGYSAAIGMEANRLQQPETATAWANFGWKALEIIKGVGDGLLLCAENIVHCIQDPKHAAKEFIHALGNLVGCCARTIGTVTHWHELMEQGNGLLMAQEMDDIATKIALCSALCAEKLAEMSARDIAKNITYVAIDMVITHKMITLGSNLCSQLKPLVFDLIKIRKKEAFLEFAIEGLEEFGSAKKIAFSTENIASSPTHQFSKTLTPLSESLAETSWISKEGLIYGPDKKFGTRINHILQHTKPNAAKLNHTVFTVADAELLDLIDFAWSKRGIALADDPGTYIIELEKIIGTKGEKAIKIVVVPGTSQIITAYPVKV